MTTQPSLQLLPLPRQLNRTNGICEATGNRRLTLIPAGRKAPDPRLLLHLQRCARNWSELVGHRLLPRVGAADNTKDGNFLELLPPNSRLPAGGYRLQISRKRMTLASADAEGAFRGLMSLDRLLRGARLPHGNTVALGCCKIQDQPGFAHRGVLLDISRCKVPKLTTLKRLIERLAAFGINQLQLYTEHTFAYSRHRRVWADASPLLADDLRKLDRHCHEHFVELVPNQNSFGHMERWLRHPEYHEFAECPEGFEHPLGGRRAFGSTLKPDAQSLRLLAELYDELLPNFRSRQFNIGGDEPWELGKGASRSRCEREGVGGVHVDFLCKLHRLVRERGRNTQFWSDLPLNHPECLPLLDKEMVALNWGYEADHPFDLEGGRLRDAGLEYYICPGTSSWNSLLGRSGNLLGNLQGAADAGRRHEALGFLITDWGDGGHHQYLPISYPGLALGAAIAWHPATAAQLSPAATINAFLQLPDEHATGRLLWELGGLAERLPAPRIRNAGLFDRLLFGEAEAGAPAAGIHDRDAAETAARLAAFLDDCLQLQGESPRETRLLQEEVRNALRLAEIGLARRAISLASGRKQAVLQAETRARLTEAITAHQELWLARNRAGGLQESCARLQQVLRQLGG